MTIMHLPRTNVKVETFEEDHANESRISKVEDQYLEQKQIRQPINYNERERIMQAHYSRLKESLERTASENVTHHSVQPEELTQSEALELMKRRQFEQFRKQQMMQHFYKQYLQYAEQNSNKDWLQQHQNREGKGQRLPTIREPAATIYVLWTRNFYSTNKTKARANVARETKG